MYQVLCETIWQFVWLPLWCVGPFGSWSDALGIIVVLLTVFLMHQMLCGFVWPCLMYQVLFWSIWQCVWCTRCCVGPFDSLSDVPGAVWVNLTVCQMHQLMCGSVCQCVRCTGVVWVYMTVFLMNQLLCESVWQSDSLTVWQFISYNRCCGDILNITNFTQALVNYWKMEIAVIFIIYT